jgi:hypothetical protein
MSAVSPCRDVPLILRLVQRVYIQSRLSWRSKGILPASNVLGIGGSLLYSLHDDVITQWFSQKGIEIYQVYIYIDEKNKSC